MNQVINNIVESLEENEIEHSLVFIDPEGLEFHWDSLGQLIKDVECDVIVNFPSAGLARCLGNPSTYPTVARFLGTPADAINGMRSDVPITYPFS